MILRATEGVVRTYYTKVTGKTANKVLLRSIIQELETKDNRLANFISYLKQYRDEGAHPGRRFKQEEAERILIQLKELIEAVRDKL